MAKKTKTPGVVDLSGTWKMKGYAPGIGREKGVYRSDFNRADFLPAPVPGTVRQALLEAGEIPDPYYGFDNEKSLWTEALEWWFYREFEIPAELKGKFIELIFAGTVFQGEVWLNNVEIGALKGMFNPRTFQVQDLLNYGGSNCLVVRLEAPEDAQNIQKSHNLTWDTPRDQLYSIAQCLFAWDWAPHAVAIGIWQPVKLAVSGAIRIHRPYVRSEIVSEQLAQIKITGDLVNLSYQDESVRLIAQVSYDGQFEPIKIEQPLALSANESRTVTFNMPIQEPKLWWPNGMGEQNLYQLHLSAVTDTLSDTKVVQFGIRELKIVENENVDEFIKTMHIHLGSQYHMGKVIGAYPWTFQINGVKMFAKGGNWIPCDHLLRLSRDRYDHLLTLARAAHMNLLRVWGGGLYETDDFYELCDAYGLLTWQEFLSNRSFAQIDRENLLEGVQATLLRIRNHPSLTFYCGGNEFDPDDFGSKDVIDALDEMIKVLDPAREFHRASPYLGDDHHWGVWHKKQPYNAYRMVRPFRSEAGINTFPVPENFRKFTPSDKLWPPDKIFIEYHGEMRPNLTHLDKLSRYAEEFGTSSTIEEFIMKSQLYQALANEFNLEFCRAHKFKNSGLLFWQFNDTWPCLSWSLVDWYGTPKPGYYYVKRACRPVHIAADFEKYLWQVGENFQAQIFLLNDERTAVTGLTYNIRLLDIYSKILAQNSGLAFADANHSNPIGFIEWPIPQQFKGKTFFIAAGLYNKDSKKVTDVIYPIAVSRSGNAAVGAADFGPEKLYYEIFSELNDIPSVPLNCSLGHPVIRMDQSNKAQTWLSVTNPTDHIAFHIRLQLVSEKERLSAFYDDNYVTLLPGEQKIIDIRLRDMTVGNGIASAKLAISGWNCPLQELAIKIVPFDGE